ncbi:GreA/GreB family elongation factor [Hydrogenophaga sp. PAMC20947]|uniref:GreA/GreB family elongation factor n=1 Tax=Hydrogenophaga sp. PAMC20947 TaxID=2565558 RepID=UPI00109DF249|nr:GreA/GreB family elongation factor [Hydrogenophaga sp. PAMC20947]QCB47153.1 transcription elongation factor GreAB [Hydrogenophaga sp. PAMC20947]
MNTPVIERVLTELDHARLSKIAGAHPTQLPDAVLEPLQDLLIDARTVPAREVRSDIVTMYAQMQVRLNGSEALSKIALCYPDDAEPANGFVSVLSPMGLALLGLRLGQTAQWLGPTGDTMAAQVEAILFQPEASGDYVT